LYDTMIRHHPPIDRVAGAGTDFAAFLQYIGVPSLDMSYGTMEDYPVYHSLYDDYVWMERFGDPLFHRHVACTELVVVQRFFISLQTLTDSFVLLA
jgi:N-acetylated-alpha-linked acidic dipeptidase